MTARPAITKIDASNSLTDLAARIVAAHQAVSTALKDSVQHAITAGELLIEAKDKVGGHGNWLPWLRDHCTISERTAQLYMRCARNREAIEDQIRNGVADLSLNEAAAMLMLSSDVRKLFALTQTMESLQGEELIKFCADNDIATLTNPFGARDPTDQEYVEWNLFALFLMREFGWPLDNAFHHVEYVQSRGTLLADWMKPNPIRDAWLPISQATFDAWNAFLESNRSRTLQDVEAEIQREDDARAEKLQAMLARKLSRKDRRLITEELDRRRLAGRGGPAKANAKGRGA